MYFPSLYIHYMYVYRIVGNFQGVQFSQMDDLVTFRGSNFADAHDHAITSMYKCDYFMDLIFAVHESTMKAAKIGPLENFLLYSIYNVGLRLVCNAPSLLSFIITLHTCRFSCWCRLKTLRTTTRFVRILTSSSSSWRNRSCGCRNCQVRRKRQRLENG